MSFWGDLKFTERYRSRLKDFYRIKAKDGRYVFINKNGKLGKELQDKAVDTILQITDNKEVYIEEKIVRWKGIKYTAFTLETQSCSVKGHEKDGCMKYGEFDWLLYGFVQVDDSIKVYIIPFQKLKRWFWANIISFPIIKTNQINKTICRIVDIELIKKEVGLKTFTIAPT